MSKRTDAKLRRLMKTRGLSRREAEEIIEQRKSRLIKLWNVVVILIVILAFLFLWGHGKILEDSKIQAPLRNLLDALLKGSSDTLVSRETPGGDVEKPQKGSSSAAQTPGPRPPGMDLIPAGEFLMGSNDNDDEQPVHTVHTEAFYMDTYEVTNAEYKRFLDENPKWRKDQIPNTYHDGDYLKHWNGNTYPSGKGDHPVVYVSWYAAMEYAAWADKRLPTEAEWEKAARGGLTNKRYPWGDAIDSSKANYEKNANGTGPTSVGNYRPNGYGLYDMAGNVSEWCLDVYNKRAYGIVSRRSPISDVTGAPRRVLRGGSWSDLRQNVRVSKRMKGEPIVSYVGIGFRCVKDVSQTPVHYRIGSIKN